MVPCQLLPKLKGNAAATIQLVIGDGKGGFSLAPTEDGSVDGRSCRSGHFGHCGIAYRAPLYVRCELPVQDERWTLNGVFISAQRRIGVRRTSIRIAVNTNDLATIRCGFPSQEREGKHCCCHRVSENRKKTVSTTRRRTRDRQPSLRHSHSRRLAADGLQLRLLKMGRE